MPRSSRESAEQTSAWSELDGAPSASPKSTPTPALSLPSDGRESRTSETSFGLLVSENGRDCVQRDRHDGTDKAMLAADPKGRPTTRWCWPLPTLDRRLPCQDLSVAGKRRGFTGERSVLAFAFLALVERHRPPAILLENVPGLLSSNGGRDMARLLGEMAELGYGVAYRVLDAQHFGVPQRRRRVFILGLRSDPDDVDGRVAAERAAAVLSVGARCGRHPATGHQAGAGVAEGAYDSTIGLREQRPARQQLRLLSHQYAA